MYVGIEESQEVGSDTEVCTDHRLPTIIPLYQRRLWRAGGGYSSLRTWLQTQIDRQICRQGRQVPGDVQSRVGTYLPRLVVYDIYPLFIMLSEIRQRTPANLRTARVPCLCLASVNLTCPALTCPDLTEPETRHIPTYLPFDHSFFFRQRTVLWQSGGEFENCMHYLGVGRYQCR